jgi:F-type H+-transporting ATPase subunit a
VKWLIVVGVIVLVAIGFLFFRLPQPIIELKPEPIFHIGSVEILNTWLTAWVMIILIGGGLWLGTRNLHVIPRGFQNLFEAVVEGFSNIANGVAGEKNGRRFFPVVFILFLWIVLCNWAALTPLFNVIGTTDDIGEHIHHEAELHPDAIVEEGEDLHGWIMTHDGITVVPLFEDVPFIEVHVPAGVTYAEREQLMYEALAAELDRPLETDEAGHVESPLHEDEVYGFIAPWLRGVNTDLNAPLSYAIWSAIFVEFWGITALGLLTYGSKFFNFKGGPIYIFVGLLELISEFARLISFTFRLFGNIFAGEVLLFMMAFLVPFLLVDVFYALEIFVGLIQAFVFAMLTLVFGVMAVSGHGDHEEHHGNEHGTSHPATAEHHA